MSISPGGTEVCPCHDNSLTHLLNVVKNKLQGTMVDERCVLSRRRFVPNF